MPNILFFGANHGQSGTSSQPSSREKTTSIVLLGDVQAQRPLEVELATILNKTIIRFFIHGNHDTDSDFDFRVQVEVADANLDGRVEEIAGVRIADLGGSFRRKIWSPLEPPTSTATPTGKSAATTRATAATSTRSRSACAHRPSELPALPFRTIASTLPASASSAVRSGRPDPPCER
jgi:hypothetical protein